MSTKWYYNDEMTSAFRMDGAGIIFCYDRRVKPPHGEVDRLIVPDYILKEMELEFETLKESEAS